MPLTKWLAMKDAAVMLRGEARRTASILHQTPGWRWRRELCLTELSQQWQSGPPPRPGDACQRGIVTTRVRHRQSTCGEQCRNWRATLASEATLDACEASSGARAGSTAGAAWKWEARAGVTARRVRVADSIEACAGGTARNTWNECG